MNEEQLARLRNRLEKKKKRLCEMQGRPFQAMLRRIWDYFTSDPWIAPLVKELLSNPKGSKAAEFAEGDFNNTNINREHINNLGMEDYASMACHIFSRNHSMFIHNQYFDIINSNVWVNSLADHKEYISFKSEVVESLFDYLDDRLDNQQALHGLILRYKTRCEWFNGPALREIAANKDPEKKRDDIEDRLKQDFFLNLHDQGIEFVKEPSSEMGRIDVVLLEKATRTYIEGKVFDNKSKGKSYIIKGFGQLLTYTRQYNSTTGYLAIYKTSEENDTSRPSPPRFADR